MKEKNQGITLIALIITIIIMLILVAVSIQMTLSSGLFKQAGKAVHDTEIARTDEENLSKGEYIDEIVEQYTGPKVVEPENIDDWEYTVEEDGTITLNCYKGTETEVVIPNYINGVPVKKIGTVSHGHPSGNGSFWHSRICSSMVGSTYVRKQEDITKVIISEGITEIASGAFWNSIALEEVIIPEGVTGLERTFDGCTSLATAPEIPSSVTNMSYTFYYCTSLTTAPEIPSSVTTMSNTFYGCTSLTGDLVINANPTDYSRCLYNCATNEGCQLQLSGSSTVLNEILGTANGNANISIK